ncbi:MAG TPA: amidohydrolase family protein [Gemmatimonadaceae bacterium]|nr:amidohydrolase family protein [Gemmatimonadaceae bacterium]
MTSTVTRTATTLATALAAVIAAAPAAAAQGHAGARAMRPDTLRYVVLNHGRDAGDLVVARSRDSLVRRFVFVDRNRGTRLEARYRLGADGRTVSGESRPVLADGTAGAPTESFEITGDSARFTSLAAGQPQTRTIKVEPGDWVGIRAQSPWEIAALAKMLLARPGATGRLQPGGVALRATVVGRATAKLGGRNVPLRLVMIWAGTATTPNGVWIDDTGELFSGDVAWFIPVRRGGEQALPALRAVEIRYRNAQAEEMEPKVRQRTAADIVIRNGDVFDADRGVMMPRTTVVVRGDRIAAVGPAGTVAEPAGATVIDATGKTVMPGMWEMHFHTQLETQSTGALLQLARGITTARDLAADPDVVTSLRDRSNKGLLAAPRYVLGGFMVGPERWAGPGGAVISNEADAIRWVATYDSLGYKQIKIYNLVHPDIVPVIVEEAHKRGMRVSGHIPRGLSVPAAVLLGFDEVQHAAFLFSTFFQDSLYVPRMRAYSQVAAIVAPNFDVDSREMSDLIAFLRDHHTVLDGTFSVWIGGGSAGVGAAATDQARNDAAYLRLLTRLHDAGVPLVAGTDQGTSATYHRELELYQQAGIPAPEVLQIATIRSAEVMREDRDYGSLTAGKVADIIVVDGHPDVNVSDLDKVETVLRAGRVYRAADLVRAVTGQP